MNTPAKVWRLPFHLRLWLRLLLAARAIAGAMRRLRGGR